MKSKKTALRFGEPMTCFYCIIVCFHCWKGPVDGDHGGGEYAFSVRFFVVPAEVRWTFFPVLQGNLFDFVSGFAVLSFHHHWGCVSVSGDGLSALGSLLNVFVLCSLPEYRVRRCLGFLLEERRVEFVSPGTFPDDGDGGDRWVKRG